MRLLSLRALKYGRCVYQDVSESLRCSSNNYLCPIHFTINYKALLTYMHASARLLKLVKLVAWTVRLLMSSLRVYICGNVGVSPWSCSSEVPDITDGRRAYDAGPTVCKLRLEACCACSINDAKSLFVAAGVLHSSTAVAMPNVPEWPRSESVRNLIVYSNTACNPLKLFSHLLNSLPW